MLSSADADLVQRDAGIPGLGTLLDPDAFAAALRSAIPRAGLGGARPTYLRYKPGTSCLAGYVVEADGQSLDVSAIGYRHEDAHKIQKTLRQAATPSTLGPGRAFLEDRAIAVSIFPNDLELQALPRLERTEARHHLLRKVLPNRPDLWGATMHRLRYKPGRRYVAQLRTERGPQAVIKVYDEPGFQAAYANAGHFGSRETLRLPRRLGHSSRHRALALEWVPGRPLDEAILAPAPDVAALASVGAALAELHAQRPDGLVPVSREAEAARLVALAPWLAFVCPNLADRVLSLSARLAARLRCKPPANHPIHGDFYAQQVLLADGAAAILDLDEAVCGDPAADLGLFLAHLELDTLRGILPPGHAVALGEALLDGYRTVAPIREFRRARVALYVAVGLFRLAPHPFRGREPHWSRLTKAIIDRARAILHDL